MDEHFFFCDDLVHIIYYKKRMWSHLDKKSLRSLYVYTFTIFASFVYLLHMPKQCLLSTEGHTSTMPIIWQW